MNVNFSLQKKELEMKKNDFMVLAQIHFLNFFSSGLDKENREMFIMEDEYFNA